MRGGISQPRWQALEQRLRIAGNILSTTRHPLDVLGQMADQLDRIRRIRARTQIIGMQLV
ncbi:MAG: hypothetical protein JW395_2832 [Nitrospira sp.]|nr:hypothetical protein [Nitrospira sp.]